MAQYSSGTTSIVDHNSYDSFGNKTPSSSANDLMFSWTGRLFDSVTGLQYNWHRWYDPHTGRWANQDRVGLGPDNKNLYRYAGNDPRQKKGTRLDIDH